MAFKSAGVERVDILPPNFEVLEIEVEGNAPFVQAKFSEKARNEIRAKMEAKGPKKSVKDRPPRDYAAEFLACQHRGHSADGSGPWSGIPAAAFRRAMIDACRLVTPKLEMTRAKMAVFIVADGTDRSDGTQLVKIVGGEPEKHESMVRNDNGATDLRVRAMWKSWGATLRVRYDADMLTVSAVVNLLSRAGLQIGVGEGRPFSKDSAGMDWGTFTVKES